MSHSRSPFDTATDPDLSALVDEIIFEGDTTRNHSIEVPDPLFLEKQVDNMLQAYFGVSELPIIYERELRNYKEEKKTEPFSLYSIAFPLRTETLKSVVEFYGDELHRLSKESNEKSLRAIAEITHSLGRVCLYLGDFHRVLTYCLIELKIRMLFLVKTKIKDGRIVATYFHLGEAHYQLKNYEEAIKFYSSALVIIKNHFSAKSGLMGDAWYALGIIHLSQGREILEATKMIIDKDMNKAENNIKNARSIFSRAEDYLYEARKFYFDHNINNNDEDFERSLPQLECGQMELSALAKICQQKKDQVSEEKCFYVGVPAHCQSDYGAVSRQIPPLTPLPGPHSYVPQRATPPFSDADGSFVPGQWVFPVYYLPVPPQAPFPMFVPSPNGHDTQRASVPASQALVSDQQMASRPSFQVLPAAQDTVAWPSFRPDSNPPGSAQFCNQHQKTMLTTSNLSQFAPPRPNGNNAPGAATSSVSQGRGAVPLPAQPMIRRPNQFFSVPAQQAAPLPTGYVKNAVTQPPPRATVLSAACYPPPVSQNKFGK